MQNLLALKKALEKPGIGRYRRNLAEQFRGKTTVPLSWVREWLKADWHTIGCKYLWLAAMNSCIGRRNTPLGIIYRGLCKPDPSTFNAAIEACRGLKIPFTMISWWYSSTNPILRIAAMNACIGKSGIPTRFIEQGLNDSDIVVRRIAEKLYQEKTGKNITQQKTRFSE